MKSINLCGFRSLLFAASVLSILPMAKAQSGSENAAFFGTFGQGNNAIVSANNQAVANMACVPTAVANGLTFLQNYQASIGGTGPLTFAPSYTSINNLIGNMGTTANGTGIGNAATGLQSYVGPGGANPAPGMSISGQYTGISTMTRNYTQGWYTGIPGSFVNETPTASFLADSLNQNFAVEFTLLWGFQTNGTFYLGGGGHELTLQAIDLQAGSISFYDPWGNSQITTVGTNTIYNAGTSALRYTGTLTQLGNGLLAVTYPTNAPTAPLEIEPDFGENDSDLPGDANGQVGYIVADMVETVPEPTSFALLGTAAVTVASLRFFRRRK
jgi:hypothetical protein